MLENVNILMLGGDARYVYIIKHLVNKNANLTIFGFDEYPFSIENITIINDDVIDFTDYDIIILPINGISSTGEIFPTFSKRTFYLTAKHLQEANEDCLIFTGTANQFLKQITERTNKQLITLFNRDDVAILNSIPTAEATLKLAIEHTDYIMHGANIYILGFGRVGFTTARLFHNIGAHVTVVTRNDSHFARVREMNMNPLHIDDLAENLNHVQIIINTIPHLVLTRTIIKQINKNSLIIDLASSPGGTNFSAAKDYNIQALHALGLPGKTAPKTAGNILGETITHILTTILSKD